MKTFIKIVFVFCISAQFISGQSSQNYWSLLQTKSKLQENWQIKPKEYFQVSLDFAGLYQEVISSSLHHITLDIPSPEGKFHSFQLAQTPVLHPNTSEKFPGFLVIMDMIPKITISLLL